MARDGDHDLPERIRAASFAARDADLGELDIHPGPEKIAADIHALKMRLAVIERKLFGDAP